MSLIAHYKLDGNANDAFGKYNGTASNVTWVDGKLGKAGSFNGGSSYIETPLSTAAHNLLSVSFWIFNQNIGSIGLMGTVSGGRTFNLFRYPNLDDFHWSTGGGSGVDYDVLPFDQWTHVVIVSDGSTIKRYYNGALKGTSAGSIVKNTSLVHIGRNDSGSSSAYIDDVRFYDHALSEREVRDLSQGLVLHYTFDQFQEPTENLLRKSGATPLVSAGDVLNRSTKTINADGSVRFINNGTGESVVRLYCNLADLSSGETYSIQVKFRENTGTVSLDWCDTTIVNGLASSTASSGLLYGIGTRATYDGVYRFLDINISSGGSITLYEDQIEKKKYVTPFVNSTRTGIVRDQSTQGNDAPLVLANTPKWVEGGMVGKGCYELAGYGKTPGILSPQIKTDKYTISFWAKHTSTSKMVFGSGRNTAFYWYMDNSWKYTHGGTSGEFYYPKSQTINIGEWGHFAVTYDGSNIIIYRNGVYEGVKASSGIPNFDRHSIGWGYSDQAYDFQGQLDDVRIYTTALSAEEIKELYKQRASLDSQGNFYSNLISSSVGYQKVWGDGTGVGFTTYGINGSSVSTNGVLRFTTINTDPMINMYNIGSFDPNVYKFIQVKYRVVSGNAGSVEIIFTNTQYTSANAAQVMRAPLNSDGNWNVVTVAMHTHSNWTNSNITGWRFDMGTASGVTIEVEWIRLVSDTGALSVKSNKVVGNFSEVGITNGLVAYYPLNKDAKDYSGNGNHGTVTGAVLTGGGFDGKGAYSFDGVNNNFIRASHEPMNPTSHTISGWFKKRSDVKTSYPIFLSYGLPYIACDGTGHPFRVSYTGNGQISAAGGVVPILNEWYYVSAVFDVGGVSLFVNGEFQTINPTPCTNASTTFDMGRHINSSAYQIDGEICNVKIFNRALTPEEIAVEYKRTGVSKMTQHNGTTYIQGQVKETI